MYLNKDDRQLILSVLVSVACAESAKDKQIFKKQKRWCSLARSFLAKAVSEATKDIDKDTLETMYREAENAHIAILPKQAAKAKGEWVLAPKSSIDRLTASNLELCALCIKEGKEIKKCQVRRDMIACSVEPRSDSDCPYKII